MATNFGSAFRLVVLVVSSAATMAVRAAADTIVYVARRARDLFFDEPLLLPIRERSGLISIAGGRIITQSAAPLASHNPEFVGSGLAFRRWR